MEANDHMQMQWRITVDGVGRHVNGLLLWSIIMPVSFLSP